MSSLGDILPSKGVSVPAVFGRTEGQGQQKENK